MEVLHHGIKTRYAYDFPFCFAHELLMSLRSNIYNMSGRVVSDVQTRALGE